LTLCERKSAKSQSQVQLVPHAQTDR